MPDTFMGAHIAPIILAAARNNVPALYFLSEFVKDGGLLSYGPDPVDIMRRAAAYVDRILRGEKPGDLPVQLPSPTMNFLRFIQSPRLRAALSMGVRQDRAPWRS